MSKARQQANLSSDGNLFADISNDRVGVGSVVPTHKLHVNGTSKFDDDVKFEGTTAAKNIIWDKSADSLKISDDVKLNIGTGNDLDIYHTTSGTSWIRHANTSEYFVIEGQQIDIRDYTTSKYRARFGTKVELRYDNTARFETTNTGAKVTGNLEVTGVLTYDDVTSVDSVGIVTARDGVHITGDNKYLKIGAGNDLGFVHTGSETFITNSTGHLTRRSDVHKWENYAGSTEYARFDASGRLLVGTATAAGNGIHVLYSTVNSAVEFQNNTTGTGSGQGLYVGNSTSNIGYLWNYANDALVFATNNTEKLRITSAGNIGVGNDASFPIYTGTNDRNFIIGTGSDDTAIQIHSGSDKYGGVYFGDATSGGDRYRGYVEYKHDDDYLRFATAGGERLRIDASGHVAIGGQVKVTSSNASTVAFSCGDANTGFYNYGTDSIAYSANGTAKWYTASNGNTIYLDDTKIFFGTGSDFRFWHDGGDNYIWGTGNHATIFATNGAERLRIRSDSNITQTIDTDGDGFIITAGDMKPMLTGNSNRSGAGYTIFGIVGKWNNTEVGRIAFEAGTDTTNKDDGKINFYTRVSGGSLISRLLINSSGKVEVAGELSAANFTLENDTGKLVLGTGSDLQLFHDGGSSVIQNINDNASFYIKGSSSGTINIKCNPNGSTQLWHNGAISLYTETNGLRVHDDVKLKFGNASDFEIYHDASHNYIKGVTAGQDVYLQSMRDFYIKAGDNAGGYHTMIYCDNNGGVRLSYDNNPRFYTKSFGVQINMNPRMDLYGTGNNIELKFITNSGTHRGSVYADNGNTIGFLKAGTGSWAARWHSDGKQTSHGAIWPNANNSYNLGDGSYRWGRVYHTQSCINTSSTNSQLTINSGSAANAVSIRNTTGGNGNVGILFSTQDHSGGREKAAIYHQETHGTAHYGGDFIFCLNTATGGATQVSASDEKMRIKRSGEVLPGADNAQDLGSSSKRWANIYTTDLQLSNEGSSNDVDGTWGNYTIQEGEDDLFLINRRNGKRYKFNLTEMY